MKAIIYEKYGPPEVLQLTVMDKPVPRDNEVLIKIHATTVHRGDVRMRSFDVPRWQWLFARLYLGVFKPRRKVLGMEFAGEITAIGDNVTKFRVGDKVFGSTFNENFGAYAEYKVMPEDGLLAPKPANVSYSEAAPIPAGAITALGIANQVGIAAGQKILIYGASGSLGTYLVQLARNRDAMVTGVCSTANLEMVQSIGAERVIDYTQYDISGLNPIYDIVIDSVGKLPRGVGKELLKEGGTYLNVHHTKDLSSDQMLSNLQELRKLVEQERLRAVIDCTYAMNQIVEAHRYVDKGHKKGNVVITIR